MTYAISDIHGEYDKLLKMLEKISFSSKDTLYILGDSVDRGQRPIDLIRYLMTLPNVFHLWGNHDIMAYSVLRHLSVEITEENAETHLDPEILNMYFDWLLDGGGTTSSQFTRLSSEEREWTLEYFEEFLPYEDITVNGRRFILAHAGFDNFSPDRELDSYTLDELTAAPLDPEKEYFDAALVIVGHTPTLSINGKAEIYKGNNSLFIDCGAAFGGKLACLCLDTLAEFYI